MNRVRLSFRYAVGRGAGHFLATLAGSGRLLGAGCPACRRVFCPARRFCPVCGSELEDPVAVGPGGRLVAWTRVGETSFGLVRLDGADGALLHHLLGERDWAIGDRVRVRLAPDRRGGIRDIAGFEPETTRCRATSAGESKTARGREGGDA